MSDIKELLTELDFEQWLDTEGIIYRRGGVSARGREINIKECPVGYPLRHALRQRSLAGRHDDQLPHHP